MREKLCYSNSTRVLSMFAHKSIAALALLGSVAVHASVLVGMPSAPRSSPSPPASAALAEEVEVSALGLEAPLPESLAAIPAPMGARASNDVAPARSAPASRSAHEAPSPTTTPDEPVFSEPVATNLAESQPASPTASESPAPLHFVMTVAPTTSPPPGGTSAAHGSEVPAGGAQGDAVYGEDGVDARPRLLAWQAPRYPGPAASAGVEVDVPVDVVIDTEGSVIEVRLPKHFGYGLDEAATAAARSYHFSRGLKAGRPVRVRMRCTVMFRLN